jgi:hypothetical protein
VGFEMNPEYYELAQRRLQGELDREASELPFGEIK